MPSQRDCRYVCCWLGAYWPPQSCVVVHCVVYTCQKPTRRGRHTAPVSSCSACKALHQLRHGGGWDFSDPNAYAA